MVPGAVVALAAVLSGNVDRAVFARALERG